MGDRLHLVTIFTKTIIETPDLRFTPLWADFRAHGHRGDRVRNDVVDRFY
jgi:hypothetical protein